MVLEEENANSINQIELTKENKQNFQVHATKALKQRGIVVKEGENANSINQQVLMKENRHPFQKLTATQTENRSNSISKSKTKEGSNTQVKWNKNLKAFIDFDGVPTQKDKEGVWLKNQRSNLRNMAKKDKVYADNLAKLKEACKDKGIIF